jgi:hypothetical protein
MVPLKLIRHGSRPASMAAAAMTWRIRLYASRQVHTSRRTIAGDLQRSAPFELPLDPADFPGTDFETLARSV